ncbi:MAG TPA: ABC transporter substrate binding protein, partial [Burkholderiales bacterium]|nr:ABC transporter substrate binding protein [Burkholderiales bacterium]
DALRVAWTGPLLIAEADTRAFAVANKLPDFWTFPIPVEKGGLLSYSPKLSEIAIRGAAIVDKILRGSNPAEIPFEYPTQYDLVINLKSARERGIVIPQSVLVRATRVIE